MHETGVAILFGIPVGILLVYVFDKPLNFSNRIFFDFILPLIVFGAGYNLKRKRFFRNIGAIGMLGVLVTLFSFVSIGSALYYFSAQGYIFNWNGWILSSDIVELTLSECLLLGATLSSSDVIAAVTLINEE